MNAPLEPDDLEVIRMVLFETYPPTNPAVLLRAAREWYLRFGDDEVLREILDRLCHVCNVRQLDLDNYEAAGRAFLEKTRVQKPDAEKMKLRGNQKPHILSLKRAVYPRYGVNFCANVQSVSRPTRVIHVVTGSMTQRWRCSCEAPSFQPRRACKHVIAVKQRVRKYGR